MRSAVFLRYPSLVRRVCRVILLHGSAFYRVFPVRLASVLMRRRLSWGFVPFSAIGCSGYVPRASTLGYRPRPRFLTVLAGILPVHPLQAYFILEALLGFSLQGFPLERSAFDSSPKAPLLSFPRWPPFLCASA